MNGQQIVDEFHRRQSIALQNEMEKYILAAGIAVILAWIVYTTVFKKGK